MKDHIVIGLTGQTGSGKSTVCNAFMEGGFEIINCDLVARAVTTDGSDCCQILSRQFPECFDDDLHLDRKALGEIVFNDKAQLEALNSLIFPFINSEIDKRIINACRSGKRLILLDAPTLFEAGADKLCQFIISCVADRELRLQRIMTRDGLEPQQAESRIESQHTEEFFRRSSDMIIENNGSLESLSRAARFAADTIKAKVMNNGNKTQKKKT